MSKNVLIDEPFQLSNYTSSYRGKQKAAVPEHIFARSIKTSSSKSKNVKEGLVTVAAQADGIHLVDISSLHSVVSHTLGPSTSFSCPAVSLALPNEQYATYAAIETSTELSNSEEAGRVVWKWNDTLSSGSDTQKESRIVLNKSERMQGLYPTTDRRILAVTRSARILLLDPDMNQKATLSIPTDGALSISRAFVFSSSECSFAPSSTATILVLASFDESSSLNIHVVSLDSDGELSVASQARLSQKRELITDISCSSSGCLTVLCSDGSWGSFSISHNAIRPLARPIKLSKMATESITLSALTSTHVLLAALPTTPSPSSIHIQIWDMQYSVLLASSSMHIPSVLGSSTPRLALVPVDGAEEANGVRGQAILVLSTPTGASSLFVVPYLVPALSTLVAAIGRGPATQFWTQADGVDASTQSKEELARSKLLADIKTAMDVGKVQVAENAFSVWEKAQESPELGYNFVKQLLQHSLPPAGKTIPPHAPGIVKSLLEKNGAVSSAMVEGGLLPALRARQDWALITLALSSVVDLPESDLVETLVVLAKLQSAQASRDAMQVDTFDPSLLPGYLAHVVTYPNATSKGIVLSLKKFVRDPQDAAPIAQILEKWIRSLSQRRNTTGEIGLFPSGKDLIKNEHGVLVVDQQRVSKRALKGTTVPPLAQVVQFLQSFMDACFLQLLQHGPSHKLVQQLQAHLVEEVSFAEILEQLRGSLEPFAIGHQKALREAAIPQKEKEKERQKGDWRQRRNGAPGVHGNVGTIGVYQVEEMAL